MSSCNLLVDVELDFRLLLAVQKCVLDLVDNERLVSKLFVPTLAIFAIGLDV